MNTEQLIIQYLREHGLDITRYIDDFRHVVPGTISIISISMWGIGTSGKYADWIKLNEILKVPGCPIQMESVRSYDHERKDAFNRLIWKGE